MQHSKTWAIICAWPRLLNPFSYVGLSRRKALMESSAFDLTSCDMSTDWSSICISLEPLGPAWQASLKLAKKISKDQCLSVTRPDLLATLQGGMGGTSSHLATGLRSPHCAVWTHNSGESIKKVRSSKKQPFEKKSHFLWKTLKKKVRWRL